MADETPNTDDLQKQIMDTAAKLGDLVAKHPAIQKYAEAQEALSNDAEATRLLQQFEQKAMVMARNEQMGQPISQNERQELEQMQTTIAGNIRVKAFSIAQTDMTDLLRKVSQTWQKPVAKAQGQEEPTSGNGGMPGGAGVQGGGMGGLSM